MLAMHERFPCQVTQCPALAEGETFTSLALRINFFRPVWKSRLTASARQVQHGRSISHYQCEIIREDG